MAGRPERAMNCLGVAGLQPPFSCDLADNRQKSLGGALAKLPGNLGAERLTGSWSRAEHQPVSIGIPKRKIHISAQHPTRAFNRIQRHAGNLGVELEEFLKRSTTNLVEDIVLVSKMHVKTGRRNADFIGDFSNCGALIPFRDKDTLGGAKNLSAP